jgi:plastocyanin
MYHDIRRLRGLTVVLLLSLAAATACGGDDGGGVRSGDAASASGSGSGSGSAVAECKPVGTELESQATQTVAVELADYKITPKDITVSAGVVTFDVTNNGPENHELAFLPGGGPVPTDSDGMPDEAALEAAGAFELGAFPAGQSCKATFDLAPGTYTTFCAVIAEDGMTHLSKGMQGTLTVT